MIFRPSQRLNAKIKAGPLQAMPPHENPLADWSAHLFVAGRRQYILLTNTKALYSTVLDGRGITRVDGFIDRALTSLRQFMADDGLEAVYRQLVVPASGSVRFAKALDRSVTGSMNDLTKHAAYLLVEGERSPHEVGVRLNDIPMSALGRGRSTAYGIPRNVFRELVDEIGP